MNLTNIHYMKDNEHIIIEIERRIKVIEKIDLHDVDNKEYYRGALSELRDLLEWLEN